MVWYLTARVIEPLKPVSSFAYAPTGALTSETWGNGAVRSVGYNSALQVSQIKLNQSSGGSELQRYDYLYGQVTQSNGSVDKTKNNGQIGRIDGVLNGSSTKEWDQRFSYDEIGRLSLAAEYQQGTGSSPSWKQEFTYDRYGNRFQSGSNNTGVPFTTVVSTDVSDTTNRFISSGSTPVTYDAAGNITQDAKFRLMNHTYDANGRQVSAAATDSDNSQTSVYDCMGQRVQTTSFSSTRTMVYDVFGKLVADYNGTSVEKENIYRGGQLLAVYEAASTCYMTISAFVTAFFQGALHRNPTSTELAQWTSALSNAQNQGNGKLIKVAQDLGTTVFTSGEYTNTNHQTYVTDLYAAYLQRSPDSGGNQNWLNALAGGSTFAQVRNGFAYSLEFQGNVVRLCPSTTSSTSPSANLKYVLTDLQGSARAVMDNNGGSSTIVARHDYLPFGEEISAGIGLRTTSQKYSVGDKVRQKFALTERDEATGLDHTWFRKYDSFAGRWTSPDPLRKRVGNPQDLNGYHYTQNDPVNRVDPSGLLCMIMTTGSDGEGNFTTSCVWFGDLFPFDPYIPPDRDPVGPTEETPNEEEDPCAKYVPSNVPEGVTADGLRQQAMDLNRILTTGGGDLGEHSTRFGMGIIAWREFYDRVKAGGVWDFKLRDQESIRAGRRSKYEEFGNFAFGMTGAAFGFTEGALLRGAGLAQQADPTSRSVGEGTPVGGWSEIFGDGGTYPFGDERSDAEAIQRGVAYHECRQQHPK